ncbi:sugar transferase [Thermus sp. CCB_US3_UF1]|uniref:sugar transferase n=1 Tax=Thermus sp. CCB_US3_UF1 TaxID=1111069 RepID=UPI0012DFC52D|nr:sugar transferase [Thermus sp. CCB_US3_UF1]
MGTLGEQRTYIRARPLPGLTAMALLLSDLLCLLLAWALALALRAGTGGSIDPSLYLRLLPALALFPFLYGAFGLYPGLGVHPALELKRLSGGTALGFLLLAAGAFLSKSGPLYSRLSFLLAFALALFLVPLGRALLRHLFARKAWWGGKVLVVGARGEEVEALLRQAPGLGLKPTPTPEGAYALVVAGSLPKEEALALLERFPRVLLLPEVGEGLLWAEVRDLGGVGALEVRQNGLLPGNLLLKRGLDLLGGAGLFLLFLLLLPPIALALYLEDGGPLFYRHPRVGQGGKRFFVLKFRTMRKDGDEVLKRHLEAHPGAKEEWERHRKLKEDPRVLRVGRWLRKFSLDELPQAVNILKGEMSLVGPRPVTEEELPRYGEALPLYLKVKPGLTGLWQVSGRNGLSYERRVALDRYYVQNWSPWLDLYILARTLWAALRGEGAG